MKVYYKLIKVCLFTSFLIFQKMPTLLDIILHVYFICSFQLILLSIITPRTLGMANSVYLSLININVVDSVSDTRNIAKCHCTCFLDI